VVQLFSPYHEKNKYSKATTQIYISMYAKSRLKYFLFNLIYLEIFFKPHQLSNFFYNFGPISVSASYKANSYKKECTEGVNIKFPNFSINDKNEIFKF